MTIFLCWEGVKWSFSAQKFDAEKVLKRCKSDQFFNWEGVKWSLSARNFGAEKVLKRCQSRGYLIAHLVHICAIQIEYFSLSNPYFTTNNLIFLISAHISLFFFGFVQFEQNLKITPVSE